jgi:hypothetical protein
VYRLPYGFGDLIRKGSPDWVPASTARVDVSCATENIPESIAEPTLASLSVR